MVGNNKFGLAGKTVLITGGCQGLGFEIAQDMLHEGMRVIIADIQKKKGIESAERLKEDGGEAEFVYVDLSSSSSVKDMISEVIEKYSTINLLVNNARASSSEIFEEMSLEDWERSMNVSLSGSFYCCREVIPVMAKAGGGSIINISSVAATGICNQATDYHVAKAGLNQLTRHLAYWAGPKGIRVNGVSPGFIIKKENIERYESDKKWKERWEWSHPLKRAGYVEDISSAILFLASDFAKFITGTNLVVDGGMTLSSPGDLLTRYAQEFE